MRLADCSAQIPIWWYPMSLREKLEALAIDNVYETLIQRLNAENEAILAGAGDEANWLSLYEQVLSYEKGVLYA
jgi:hypothetical protein